MTKTQTTSRLTLLLLALILVMNACSSRDSRGRGISPTNDDAGIQAQDTDLLDDASESYLDAENDPGDTNEPDNQDASLPPGDTYQPDNQDASPPADDTYQPPTDLDVITTKTATYIGKLKANRTTAFKLEASQDDTIVMRLKRANNESWLPAIYIERPDNSGTIVYHDPNENTDAHIPFKEHELQTGFTFRFDGPYTLILKNRSAFDGNYVLTVDCLSGPCRGGSQPPTSPVPNLITTHTKTYTGSMLPFESLTTTIQSGLEDTVVMRLSSADGNPWRKSIGVYSLFGEGAIIATDQPFDETADANIPRIVQVPPVGLTFRYADNYKIILTNDSNYRVNYRFSVECLHGPCAE